jgi:GxxExxY protein
MIDKKLSEPSAYVDELARNVISAAIEVHRNLGPGFLESVYEESLCLELKLRNILFERQKKFDIYFKDSLVGEGRIDLLIDNNLIVELKAVEALAPLHYAQVTSYLKAMNLQLALLINFNVPLLKDGIKRIISSPR